MKLKCAVCSTKIPSMMKLMHTCKCGKVVCSKHKSENLHSCDFNWKVKGKERLAESLYSAVPERSQVAQI